jgi:hypothetical protein
MLVVLRTRQAPNGVEYWSLTVGSPYVVISIEADLYRLINDRGEPIIYDPVCFEVIDRQEPPFWLSVQGEEGERYASPPGWNTPGFFEEWHDGNPVVRELFAAQLAYWYGLISIASTDSE